MGISPGKSQKESITGGIGGHKTSRRDNAAYHLKRKLSRETTSTTVQGQKELVLPQTKHSISDNLYQNLSEVV